MKVHGSDERRNVYETDGQDQTGKGTAEKRY